MESKLIEVKEENNDKEDKIDEDKSLIDTINQKFNNKIRVLNEEIKDKGETIGELNKAIGTKITNWSFII